jgi:hypothetical protein
VLGDGALGRFLPPLRGCLPIPPRLHLLGHRGPP